MGIFRLVLNGWSFQMSPIGQLYEVRNEKSKSNHATPIAFASNKKTLPLALFPCFVFLKAVFVFFDLLGRKSVEVSFG